MGAKPEALDVSELVERATKRMARRLTGHQLVISAPAELPLVMVDPLLMEQALVNLIDNAVKYSPAHAIIRIRAEPWGDGVQIAVEDEGSGIPIEALPHIFDKFYRAKASDRRIAGTGLGLAVARGFVEAFGGTLNAENRSDRSGARMTITVPVAAEPGMTNGQ